MELWIWITRWSLFCFKAVLDVSSKKKTLTTIFPVRVYINKINNRYKLELQLPEIMKMFGSTKKLIGKKNNGENVPRLDVVEVGLVKCNLVDNQY